MLQAVELAEVHASLPLHFKECGTVEKCPLHHHPCDVAQEQRVRRFDARGKHPRRSFELNAPAFEGMEFLVKFAQLAMRLQKRSGAGRPVQAQHI